MWVAIPSPTSRIFLVFFGIKNLLCSSAQLCYIVLYLDTLSMGVPVYTALNKLSTSSTECTLKC